MFSDTIVECSLKRHPCLTKSFWDDKHSHTRYKNVALHSDTVSEKINSSSLVNSTTLEEE